MAALHPDVLLRPTARCRSSCAAPAQYVYDQNGKRYLDGLAGLFVSQIGHGRKEVAEAGARQASELAYFPLWSYAHPRAIELAERLADLAPGDLNRVFFTTSGSEAVESAWKLAKQYFKTIGEPGRYKVLSRDIAYHGTSMGALAITGLPGHQGAVRAAAAGRGPGAEHQLLPGARRSWPTTSTAFGRWAADEIERAILREGPESVAAVFLEPVQNSGGCFPPPPGYFERVREICDRYGVLLVSDEVICAFGRLGYYFGSRALRLPAGHHHLRQGRHLRLRPARRHDGQRPADGAVHRGHGHLPARGHVRRAPGLLARWRWPTWTCSRRRTCSATCGPTRPRSAPPWRSCCDLPIVGDVRGDGYFYGIELVKDKATRETFSDDESERLLRGFLSQALFDAGLVCRADDRGDPVIQLSPPLTCGPEHFTRWSRSCAACSPRPGPGSEPGGPAAGRLDSGPRAVAKSCPYPRMNSS